MNKKIILDITNLSVSGRLHQVTQQVSAGEQIHLLGANGAGKSTLLAALSGCESYTGNIYLNHINLKNYSAQELGQQRAYLTQQMGILPSLKVFQYLGLFTSNCDVNRSIFDVLCRDFQLLPLLAKSINQLSGGEWQRVRIVAMFLQVWDSHVLSGKIIFFDEPINNLDIIHQGILDKWVKYFCDCSGTVIMSGHNLSHSYKNASQIWMIKKGTLIYTGKPDEIMTDINLSDIFMADIQLTHNSSHRVWQIIDFDN
ncbi:ATP-binding cassette domain-containing protein [Providencia rustigianii]|uniref:vitamin B12 ABC transporter ATP-binding protein BtuD n=1 Tax=Providencia rustigianii TaxID=158850 RepID=UPI000F6C6B7E|nr:ATP-binding cassette domain-containing protein [Providencia rustigianii]MTC60787.1 ATP-binding cassette domain-containing protein [Providencia rustigianii]VEH55198.1 Vitamin B12 import ATP-binding protein BtuD [Providencia rustigianii]